MAGDLNHLSPHADFSYRILFFYQFDLPMCRNKQVVIFTPTNGNVSFFLKLSDEEKFLLFQYGEINGKSAMLSYRGPAPFHRLTPNKRFEPVFSTVIMAVCSLFNRMLLLTDLIPLHLLYCGQTVMIGCNHTSFEWTRAVRHIYGIKRYMQASIGMLDARMQIHDNIDPN